MRSTRRRRSGWSACWRSWSSKVGSHFQQTGDRILLLGETTGVLGGSAYWTHVRDFTGGTPAAVDLEAEAALQRLLVAAAKAMLLRSAHDCSTGGLAIALAEAAIGGPYATGTLGAGLGLKEYGSAPDDVALLYGEDQGRVVVSCDPANEARLVATGQRSSACRCSRQAWWDQPKEALVIVTGARAGTSGRPKRCVRSTSPRSRGG